MGAVESVLRPPPSYQEVESLVSLTQKLLAKMRAMVVVLDGIEPNIFQRIQFAETKKQFLIATERIERALGECSALDEYARAVEELEQLFYGRGDNAQPLISR